MPEAIDGAHRHSRRPIFRLPRRDLWCESGYSYDPYNPGGKTMCGVIHSASMTGGVTVSTCRGVR